MSFTITIAHSWCIRCNFFKRELILNIFYPATRPISITATRSDNLGQRLIAQLAKLQFCTIHQALAESMCETLRCVTTNMKTPNLTLCNVYPFGLQRYLLPIQRLTWTYCPVPLETLHKLFVYICVFRTYLFDI